MAVSTFEGVVEAGQIRLLSGESLPDQTVVYVVVPKWTQDAMPEFAVTLPPNPRIMSPRLTRKEAPHFEMEVDEVKGTNDAEL